eukprot:3324913-Rhodomonas_salina.1
MWVRFTEARLTVLHARAVRATHAKEIDDLMTALSYAPTDAWRPKRPGPGRRPCCRPGSQRHAGPCSKLRP